MSSIDGFTVGAPGSTPGTSIPHTRGASNSDPVAAASGGNQQMQYSVLANLTDAIRGIQLQLMDLSRQQVEGIHLRQTQVEDAVAWALRRHGGDAGTATPVPAHQAGPSIATSGDNLSSRPAAAAPTLGIPQQPPSATGATVAPSAVTVPTTSARSRRGSDGGDESITVGEDTSTDEEGSIAEDARDVQMRRLVTTAIQQAFAKMDRSFQPSEYGLQANLVKRLEMSLDRRLKGLPPLRELRLAGEDRVVDGVNLDAPLTETHWPRPAGSPSAAPYQTEHLKQFRPPSSAANTAGIKTKEGVEEYTMLYSFLSFNQESLKDAHQLVRSIEALAECVTQEQLSADQTTKMLQGLSQWGEDLLTRLVRERSLLTERFDIIHNKADASDAFGPAVAKAYQISHLMERRTITTPALEKKYRELAAKADAEALVQAAKAAVASTYTSEQKPASSSRSSGSTSGRSRSNGSGGGGRSSSRGRTAEFKNATNGTTTGNTYTSNSGAKSRGSRGRNDKTDASGAAGTGTNGDGKGAAAAAASSVTH